jgi:hypothetical protein
MTLEVGRSSAAVEFSASSKDEATAGTRQNTMKCLWNTISVSVSASRVIIDAQYVMKVLWKEQIRVRSG